VKTEGFDNFIQFLYISYLFTRLQGSKTMKAITFLVLFDRASKNLNSTGVTGPIEKNP